MLSWILSCLIPIGFTAVAIAIEPRRLRNAFYCLCTLGWIFLALTQTIYYSNGKQHTVFLSILFLSIPLLYIALTVFLLVNGVVVLKKEGVCAAHLLPLALGVLMAVLPCFWLLWLFGSLRRVNTAFLLFTILWAFYIAVTLMGYLVYSVLYCLLPKSPRCDYIIIHGAGLMPDGAVTPLLRQRVEKAFRLYSRCKKKKPLFVASGGQGSDECRSEASAIRECLLSLGVPAEAILLEECSTTTYENLLYTRELLAGREPQPYRCLFVTNNYHVLRTAFYARRLKMNAKGVGCRTAQYYLPSAFIREYLAIVVRYKWLTILYGLFTVVLCAKLW